ncbi:CTAG/Pcc1 family [Lipomyces tetrasporus]|uniref:CTAG/Pcc1 family n=1 Tax=Lipomyces tetrasporus TaxID=54092 RepID=A0AAD7QKE4_9ASCO|nr:CTAG/Pcc1 family [Lipomyces tetrasporus]KAJ8096856.1 CTAG/Pcc1 family [Lipomyces tetrasporus]
MTTHDHHLTLTIPFSTPRQAQIAYNAISPDPQLKPDQFTQVLSVSKAIGSCDESNNPGRILIAKFEAESERVLRVGVNGFLESLGVVVGCLKDLDYHSS